MADRRFLVDLDLSGNQIKRMRVENLAEDPTGEDLYEGRLWFNTTTHTLKTFADGGVRLISTGTLSDTTPAPLGSATQGMSDEASRADHVHQAPTPAGIGAAAQADLAAVFAFAQSIELVALATFAPTVQALHTGPTLTLAAQHAGKIIPVDASANSVEVQVGAALFGASGSGRAFVCQLRIDDATETISFYSLSPGLEIYFHGETTVAAGDWITLVVDSATSATVFISRRLAP